MAGASGAVANFCQPAGPHCVYLYSGEAGVPRRPSAKLTLGNQFSAPYLAGEYSLYQLELWDFAGNRRVMTSSAFGGETDFWQFFHSTSLTLLP